MRAIGWACLGALAATACGPGDSGSGKAARTLTIRMGGNGSGVVRSSNPAIDCSLQCAQSVASTAKVQLTAVAAAGSTFAGWQGACSGSADCGLTMDADREVTAVFTLGQPPISHVVVRFPGKGGGRVTSIPSGIDCPAMCSLAVPSGSTVVLAAQADPSSTFVGWSGACAGDQACSFTADGDATAWANFDVKALPPPPPASCAGMSPPDEVAMQQFVHQQDGRWYTCFPGLGDANGTLVFPRAYNDSNVHGSQFEFVTVAGVHLSDDYDSSESPKPFQQPTGVVVAGDAGHLRPIQEMMLIRTWDATGEAAGELNLRAENFAYAPDPSGGILFAGDLSATSFGPLSHAVAMYNGGGTSPQLRWGPKTLASAGAVYGAGVDLLGRTLVVTNGEKFAPETISAQWFDRDGAALTGEFVLATGFTAGESTWFETSPLIGSGLAVRRMDYSYAQPGIFHARALAVVDSGQPSVHAPPAWMASRPDTRLQITRSGRGYAVVPYGAKAVTCSQRIEVLAPDGASCGGRDYPIASGTCDTHDLALGADGTVIQLLPDTMETKDPVMLTHTCTWRWWANAVR
jgi:hypothetical protein